MLTTSPTAADYQRVFDEARAFEYPDVDAFEQRMGYAIDRQRLEDVARVLACPVKANPAHWQHGRVIYAAASSYLNELKPHQLRMLDVGTAKGFSAWCLSRAAGDHGQAAEIAITSVDVIDPNARVRRNTVAELDDLRTLSETLTPWVSFSMIEFVKSTGIDWLNAHAERINVAFVDGKHTGETVRQEGKLLAKRQEPGDLAVFDDCQIPGVSVAVVSLEEWYRIEYVKAGPREYGIARRR